jgi:hypothetical protein
MQLGFHASKHKAANIKLLSHAFLYAFLTAAVPSSASSGGNGVSRTSSFFSALRTILRLQIQSI